MAVRSTVLGHGTTSGSVPVSIFTCPAGFVAICKNIAGGGNFFAANAESFFVVLYQPSGGSAFPIYGGYTFTDSIGGLGALQLANDSVWQALEPGDQLLIADNGGATSSVVASGALLLNS